MARSLSVLSLFVPRLNQKTHKNTSNPRVTKAIKPSIRSSSVSFAVLHAARIPEDARGWGNLAGNAAGPLAGPPVETSPSAVTRPEWVVTFGLFLRHTPSGLSF